MRGGADASGTDGLGLLMSIKGPALALRLIFYKPGAPHQGACPKLFYTRYCCRWCGKVAWRPAGAKIPAGTRPLPSGVGHSRPAFSLEVSVRVRVSESDCHARRHVLSFCQAKPTSAGYPARLSLEKDWWYRLYREKPNPPKSPFNKGGL